jgi:hypothetical protein
MFSVLSVMREGIRRPTKWAFVGGTLILITEIVSGYICLSEASRDATNQPDDFGVAIQIQPKACLRAASLWNAINHIAVAINDTSIRDASEGKNGGGMGVIPRP